MGRASDSPIAPVDVRGVPMMVCIDGPNHGAVYFVDHGTNSWAERTRMAKLDGEDPHTGRTLGYVMTEEKVPHPRWPAEKVRIYRWGGRRRVGGSE
jgi:hypothetical protein